MKSRETRTGRQPGLTQQEDHGVRHSASTGAARDSCSSPRRSSGESREAFPAVPPASEEAVDKWRQRRTFRHHQDNAQRQEKEYYGHQPPLLANFQEIPKFFKDRDFFHGVTDAFINLNKLCATMRLPSALRWAVSPSK